MEEEEKSKSEFGLENKGKKLQQICHRKGTHTQAQELILVSFLLGRFGR